MEHSLAAYLRRLPTETLKEFLQDCEDRPQEEHFLAIIEEVSRELVRRKSVSQDPQPNDCS